MKRALIVSYYFPPVTGAASWRVYSWAQHFKKFGIEPTIVTRHWTGNENKWEDFFSESNFKPESKSFDDYQLYILPSKNFLLGNFLLRHKMLNRIFHKFYHWSMLLLGHINIEVNAYATFKSFLKKILTEQEFDFIILTSPPNNIVRLIECIPNKTEIKLVVDFRDIYNNSTLRKNYKPGFGERLSNSLTKYHLKKWLIHADLIIAPSDAFRLAMTSLVDKKSITIYNGYESELFEEAKPQPNGIFNISIIGNIYNFQDLSLILPGLKEFLKSKSPEKVRVNLIGLDANPQVYSKFKSTLPNEFLYLSARVSKQEAVQFAINSHVLLYPCLPGHKGQMSVKLYDYMASGNPILIAPSDNDIIEKIILETNSGIIANNVEMVVEYLENWYAEWCSTGNVKMNSNKNEIEKYSRRNQAKIFAEELLKLN